MLELATHEGITASARNEAYGCVFGRDTSITVLKLLNVIAKKPDLILQERVRRALEILITLQGKEHNIESGEQPGKCIHEYRTSSFEHLVRREKPWYVYSDSTLRNFDSIDATPLFLLAVHKYWETTGDLDFLMHSFGAVEAALTWTMSLGDADGDYLLEYTLPAERAHGGLCVQSWTDSRDSLQRPDGSFPLYPIAPVEVQGMAWAALEKWSTVYRKYSPHFASQLTEFAAKMKKAFNEKFSFTDGSEWYLAQALDGTKKQIQTITPNPLLCLWSSTYTDGKVQSIIATDKIPSIVKRGFSSDIFDPTAGLRTMSMKAPTFRATRDSYHNGSFWPMLNGLIHEGLYSWNFTDEANRLSEATVGSLLHFGFPIELFCKTSEGIFEEYVSPRGKKGCRYQAWSAAAALDLLT